MKFQRPPVFESWELLKVLNIVSLSLMLCSVIFLLFLWQHYRKGAEVSRFTPYLFALSAFTVLFLWLSFSYHFSFNQLLLSFQLALNIVLSLAYPVIAVAYLIANLVLRPWEFMPDDKLLSLLPRGLALLCILSWVLDGICKRRITIYWNSTLTLFVAFVLWLFVATCLATGDIAYTADQHLSAFFPVSVIFLLVVHTIRSKLDLKMFIAVFAIAVSGMVLSGMYLTRMTSGAFIGDTRLLMVGLWANANDIAALIAMLLPLVYFAGFARVRKRYLLKFFTLSIITIGILGVWSSQSRAAILSLGLALLAYFIFCIKFKMRWVLSLVILVALPLVLVTAINREASDLTESSSARLNYLITGLKMVKQHPVFGVGMNNYPKFYESFSSSFTEWGERTAHSSWVLVMSEAGLIGLALFVLIYLLVLRRAWQLRTTNPEFLLAMITYGVCMSFLSHSYLFSPYLLFALVLAAYRIYLPKPIESRSVRGQKQRQPILKSGRFKRAFLVPLLLVSFCFSSDLKAADELFLSGVAGIAKPLGAYEPPTADTIYLQGSRGEVLNFLVKWQPGVKLNTPRCQRIEQRCDRLNIKKQKKLRHCRTLRSRKSKKARDALKRCRARIKEIRKEQNRCKRRKGRCILEKRECSTFSFTDFSKADTGSEKTFTPEALLYALKPIKTRYPSYPEAFVGKQLDPVIPLKDDQICPTDVKAPYWYLGEFHVPLKLAAGDYKAKLNVGSDEVSINLKVWQMTMPQDKPRLPVYSELTTWYNLLGHFGKYKEQEAELAAAYIAKMKEHFVYPLKAAITWPKVYRSGEFYRLDVDNYPDKKQSFSSVTLSQRPESLYYDIPGANFENNAGGAGLVNYYKAVENTIASINRPGKAIVYLWDEPTPEQQPELIKLARLVKEHAPSLKTMVTVPYASKFEGLIDIFVPVMDHYGRDGWPGHEVYQKIQAQGKGVWWYISCMSHGCDALEDSGMPDLVIDRGGAHVRSIGWLSVKYGLDAFLYYSVNNAYQYYPKVDPWDSLWDFSGNGDGTLFYPARKGERGFSKEAPISSLRLKLLRETVYDAEYMAWMEELEEKPDWWQDELAKLVPSTKKWSRDYFAYQRLRAKIGGFLDSK